MRTIEYGLVILEGRSGVGRDRFGDQDGGEEENKRRLPVQTILATAGSLRGTDSGLLPASTPS